MELSGDQFSRQSTIRRLHLEAIPLTEETNTLRGQIDGGFVVSARLGVEPDQGIVAFHKLKAVGITQLLEDAAGVMLDKEGSKVQFIDGDVHVFLEPEAKDKILDMLGLQRAPLLVVQPVAFVACVGFPFGPVYPVRSRCSSRFLGGDNGDQGAQDLIDAL